MSFQLLSAVSCGSVSYVTGVCRSSHRTGPNWTCYLLTVFRRIDTHANAIRAPEPLPFILLAYAPDESIGAEIERARIAKAIAANRLKEIHFISDFLPRLRPAGQEYGRELLWRQRALYRTSRPGDRRTAHSATAGTAPVPSLIAYFGGAVVLGTEQRSRIARYAWPGLMGRRPKSARLSTR